MKNNTENVKEELKRILRKVPQDFTLFEVRRYINLAIQKIESVEKKRKNKQNKLIERKEIAALNKQQYGAKNEE